jgi:hypothetical protein
MDGVFVFKERKVRYFPVTNPPYEKQVINISETVGCIANDSIQEIDGTLYWMGADGYWSYNPEIGEPKRVSWHVDTSEDYGMLVSSEGIRGAASAIYNREDKQLWISFDDSKTWCYNTTIPDVLVEQTSTGGMINKQVSKWSWNTFGFRAAIEAWDGMMISIDKNGQYWYERTSRYDDTSAITSKVYLSYKTYGITGHDKQIMLQSVMAYLESHDITVKTEVDNGRDEDSYTISAIDGAKFSEDSFDRNPNGTFVLWVGGTNGLRVHTTPMPQTMVGSIFRVKIEGAEFMLSAIEQEIVLRKRHYS